MTGPADTPVAAYSADRSLKGKLRRRLVRLQLRRPLPAAPDGPAISFSFDDIPATAAEAGAAVLEAAGARGTFYVCVGLAGREGPMGRYASLEAVSRLARRGHEVGCHTHGHLDCGQAAGAEIAADVEANARALAGLGIRPASFAYPYGDVSRQAKQALAGRFAALRALHPGLVRPGADLNQLPAVGVEGPDGEARAARWIDRALAERAWLILYTHDVAEQPSPWGCTPAALARLVERARAGGARVAPVAEALAGLEAAA